MLSSLPRLDGGAWLLNLASISSIFVFVAAIEYALVALLFRVEIRLYRVIQSAPATSKKEDLEVRAT